MGTQCPPYGQWLPVTCSPTAQHVFTMGLCSFLYLVDYIVPYSYCKLTICSYIPQFGIRKKQSSLLSMEELFRYYLENIIIIRIGTGLRYLWLRFVRHRKISYRTLYDGSKLKKTTELSNFDNGQYGVFGGIR